VFPSRFDNLPYDCLEAMSLGKAIVGSSQGGMVDLLDEGRAGLLHTPPDPEDLACRVAELLASPELRRRLGRAARTRATTAFAREASLDAAERFYRRAVAERRRANASKRPVRPG
ncbi:MAG: glycosyltransferase, partial [Deinococcales bacterium]